MSEGLGSGHLSADQTRTLSEAVILLIDDWRARIEHNRSQGSASESGLLKSIRQDSDTFQFVQSIFETVALPREMFARASGLQELADQTPESLPPRLKLALQVSGLVSAGLPWGVVPVVKSRFRAHLSPILTTASAPKIPRALEAKNDAKSNDSAVQTELSAATKVSVAAHPVTELLRQANIAGVEADIEFWQEPALGVRSAEANLERILAYIALPRTTHVTVDLEAIIPNPGVWASDWLGSHKHPQLIKIAQAAMAHDVAVTISAQTYSLALTLASITETLLADSRFDSLKFGVRIYAELPESSALTLSLIETASARAARNAEPLNIVVSSRSIRHLEQITSIERGLAVPSLESRADRDAQTIRLIEALLSVGSAVHTVYEGVDAVLLAISRVLATRHKAESHFSLQLRRGVTTELADTLKQSHRIRVSSPVVSRSEFASSIDRVLSLFAEVVDDEAGFASNEQLFGSPRDTENDQLLRSLVLNRTLAALQSLESSAPASHRLQDRGAEWIASTPDTTNFYRPPTSVHDFDTGGLTAAVLTLATQETGEVRLQNLAEPQSVPLVSRSGFANEPDTDATKQSNRQWVRSQLQRGESDDGGKGNDAGLGSTDSVACLSTCEFNVSVDWRELSEHQRASVLRRAALALAAARDRLFNIIGRDLGLPVAEIDHSINSAIDSARYVASLAEGLRAVRGASFEPDATILIAAGYDAGVQDVAESLAATLATGSSVVLIVSPNLAATFRAIIEEWRIAGLPLEATTLIVSGAGSNEFDEQTLELSQNQSFIRALMFCDEKLVSKVRLLRPELVVQASTPKIGSVIVTISADRTKAISNIVTSAFAQGGAHAQQTRAVICAGKGFKHERFKARLKDTVAALTIGNRRDIGDSRSDGINELQDDPLLNELAPLQRAPSAEQLRALTELAPGESWVLEPQQLDAEGLVWSPGIRDGVAADAWFWQAAQSVPVIGLMSAATVAEATKIQNLIFGDKVAALQSTDEAEIVLWLQESNAATLVVNKSSTRGRTERMPVGSWGDDSQAAWPLMGAANRLITMGTWHLREGTQSDTLHLRGLPDRIAALIEAAQSSLTYDSFDRIRRAALADTLTWQTQMATTKDVSRLQIEHNFLRYRSLPVHVRASEGSSLEELVRVMLAGLLTGAEITLSVAETLPRNIDDALFAQGINAVFESDEEWLGRLQSLGAEISGEGEQLAKRIRLIGGNAALVVDMVSFHEALSVRHEPVTLAGATELLVFLREQALSVAATRHGFAASMPLVEDWLSS